MVYPIDINAGFFHFREVSQPIKAMKKLFLLLSAIVLCAAGCVTNQAGPADSGIGLRNQTGSGANYKPGNDPRNFEKH